MKNFFRDQRRWLLLGLSVIVTSAIGNVANAKGLIDWPKQFDIVCRLRGRVVSDPHPTYVGTYPANVKRWSETSRSIVDLSSMKYCDDVDCKKFPAQSIFSVSKDKIVFQKRRGFESILKRRQNFLREKLIDVDRVSVTQGYCRIEKFSGFPAVAPSIP